MSGESTLVELNWEPTSDPQVLRARVFGGWLVRMDHEVIHDRPDQGLVSGWDWRPALTFVPDPNYEWGNNRVKS